MYSFHNLDLETLIDISLPGDKMRKLRDIVEIYKLALGNGGKGNNERKAAEE